MPAQRPHTCKGCPAHNWGVGFVPPEGPPTANFLILGQGPGEEEARHSQPFFHDAQAGWRLNQWLYTAHLQRGECLIGNLVWCWLPEGRKDGRPWGNRDPSLSEARWCWNAHTGPWVHEWYAQKCVPPTGPAHIIPVGVPAAKWMLGLPWDKGADRFAGTSQRVPLPPIGENNHGNQ